MDLNAALHTLCLEGDAPLDIAELALHLARDEYPSIDVDAYLGELDAMAREAQRYVRGDLQARVHGLCRYLFHEMGFHGNQKDYYDPLNSYFNQVLERRTGIPITLSILTMAIGNRVGLHMDGVGLPGHFVVKAVEDEQQLVFDPFHGGRVLTAQDCENVVRQASGRDIIVTAATLERLPLCLLVMRMLNNLKTIYLKQTDMPRAIRVLERLRQLAPDDAELQRDLGICLVHAGKPGKAIDLLAAYVEVAAEAMDAEAVRDVLRRARAAVAGWN
ncbi:MAG TPA: transglutaminase-like domain-containing protein [Gemmataceae bacterium]|nr:transglutaminase-like domain-containing protein [Gemmataceae bacterium]